MVYNSYVVYSQKREVRGKVEECVYIKKKTFSGALKIYE
jgi:hypothetical protein